VLGLDLARQGLEARRRTGAVFHESCLRGDLTLDENLRYYAGLYGVRDGAERAERLADRVGLGGRRGDPVRVYSQGMQKRAALARSLVHDPELWLLDEPFSGLDPDGRTLLEGLIGQERGAGRTVVLVLHDVELGLRLADDAALLEGGAAAARGLEEVRRRLDGGAGPKDAAAAGPAGVPAGAAGG
jgi:heme exporter protein A